MHLPPNTKHILVYGYHVLLVDGGVCIEKRASPEQTKLILKYLVDEGICHTMPLSSDGGIDSKHPEF